MDCPQCSVEMKEIVESDSAMQRCPDCGGLWADGVDITRILLHANLPALSAIGGYANADEIVGQCPACQVDLVMVEGGEKRSLHYDTCESCGGIWTDSSEEEEVSETIDWKAAQAQVVAFFRRFARK